MRGSLATVVVALLALIAGQLGLIGSAFGYPFLAWLGMPLTWFGVVVLVFALVQRLIEAFGPGTDRHTEPGEASTPRASRVPDPHPRRPRNR